MAYKGLFQIDDATLFKTLMKAAEAGMLVMVHAENGDVIDVLVKEALAKGHRSPEWHALTRPAWAEAEATMRATALAGIAGAPLYVVHVTNSLAVDQIAYGRARGLRVMGETCTQYLFFTIDNLRQPDGAKWVCSPPMRTPADNAALWQALAQQLAPGRVDRPLSLFLRWHSAHRIRGPAIAIPGKELGKDSFDKIPNGVPGIEDRMPILWTYGVGQGHFSLNRLVEIGCTNPAKIFGLYPRKGTIAVGADADVVIWDPQAVKTMGARTSHQRTDYNLYEGWQVRGLPEKVFLRGNLLVDGETWNGEPGGGTWLKRSAHAPVI